MALNHSWKSAAFILGLFAAATTSMLLEGAGQRVALALGRDFVATSGAPNFAPHRLLTKQEEQAAQIAWTYIEGNTQPDTGFVNSVNGFPSSTLWDQGSYLMALMSALRLGIITQSEFDERMDLFLIGLARLELITNALPNKVYNTKTLLMTDYADKPTPEGLGWSALDIARLLLGLRIIEKHAPQHGPAIRDILYAWNFDAMTKNGELFGSSRNDDTLEKLQEGRIGYEQYGARAAALWGMDVLRSISADRILAWVEIEGVDVPIDIRSDKQFGTINPTLSEPYILMALELGLDAESAILAERVFQAQEKRFDATGHITMVSEDHIDKAPYFVYTSVYSNGDEWAIVAPNGKKYPDLRTQSVKATFAWNALFNNDYTNQAMGRIADLHDPDKGWYAGIYEATDDANKSLSLNTNAVVLEALHYTVFGPLWSVNAEFADDAGGTDQGK